MQPHDLILKRERHGERMEYVLYLCDGTHVLKRVAARGRTRLSPSNAPSSSGRPQDRCTTRPRRIVSRRSERRTSAIRLRAVVRAPVPAKRGRLWPLGVDETGARHPSQPWVAATHHNSRSRKTDLAGET